MRLNQLFREADKDIRRLERQNIPKPGSQRYNTWRSGNPQDYDEHVAELTRVGRIKTANEVLKAIHEMIYHDTQNVFDEISRLDAGLGSLENALIVEIDKIAHENYQKEIMDDEIGRSGIYYQAKIYQSPAGGYWYWIFGSASGPDDGDEYNYGPIDEIDIPKEGHLIEYLSDYLT